MQTKKTVTALALAFASTLAAANWPSQPIRLIVPYAPGGGNDSISRLVAKQLEEKLKVSVVVDNKGGANGTIGMNLLKQAKPDGYTLGTVPSGPFDVNPTLMGSVPYDPAKDFTYIGPMVKFPLFLAVSSSAGVKTLPELIAKAKAQPGHVTYSSAGIGNSTHLAGALLAHATGTQMTHVAYRGTGPAAVAVLSGEVTFTFGSGPSILEYVNSGKVIGLGVSELTRLETEAKTPTIAEQGVQGFEASSWAGIVAPAGLPPAIADKLTKALREVMENPAFRKQVTARGMVPLSGNGQDFEAMVKKDAQKWGKLITSANIKAE
ncbi:Argininosuccinate lyase [Variovorax sp. PBL-H6]|uniref:Bug family tripartite tricarboxylate transporter substrate binding protein n=1 Tax=Variovorax sp. PBL-H6 TaxID=434009 RepID=UPI001316157A|nr:tripartite tricarboxylate transporter substrate binding protein [Variovorax sp. PBL-H6]VTU23070.1 Argininosuccinate lyase [Variovorax sp. PBL-H6]